MEQYNKDNLTFEIIKSRGRKMIKREQKQIKDFFSAIIPGITKDFECFNPLFLENSEKINGFRIRVYSNKESFLRVLADFLAFIQGTKSPTLFNKKSFIIDGYIVSQREN
jgi:hypothetical protein